MIVANHYCVQRDHIMSPKLSINQNLKRISTPSLGVQEQCCLCLFVTSWPVFFFLCKLPREKFKLPTSPAIAVAVLELALAVPCSSCPHVKVSLGKKLNPKWLPTVMPVLIAICVSVCVNGGTTEWMMQPANVIEQMIKK